MYEKLDKELIIFDMEGTLTHDGELLPWTERLTEVLGKTEVKLAVISDLPTDKIKKLLTDAGLDADMFNSVISSAHYKEGFETAVKEADTTSDKTVVCTASAVGVKIAKRCGMTSAAVKTHFAEDFYRKAGADMVCADLNELTDFLGIK